MIVHVDDSNYAKDIKQEKNSVHEQIDPIEKYHTEPEYLEPETMYESDDDVEETNVVPVKIKSKWAEKKLSKNKKPKFRLLTEDSVDVVFGCRKDLNCEDFEVAIYNQVCF